MQNEGEHYTRVISKLVSKIFCLIPSGGRRFASCANSIVLCMQSKSNYSNNTNQRDRHFLTFQSYLWTYECFVQSEYKYWKINH